MKKRSFRLKQFGLLVLVALTGLLSAVSIHQIGWSVSHSEDYLLVLTVIAAVIMSGFMITLFILSLRYYRLSVEERDLKHAPRSIIGHIQEQLAAIRISKLSILIISLSLVLLTLPILRFIVYDKKGLAVVCYAKAAQSDLLVNDLLEELNGLVLAQEISAPTARDVRGVVSDCEEPTDQEVGVTIFEQGMKLSATQKWVRAVLKSDGYEWVKNEQFLPYGKEPVGPLKTYPISYIADTFTSDDRQLRVEYALESNVQCDKAVCEETQSPLAQAPLKYLFATLRLKP